MNGVRVFLSHVLLFLWELDLLLVDGLRTCDLKDFEYKYTECSHSGQRWKVAVLKEVGKCEGGTVPYPEIGKNCTFTCEKGKYLDMDSQQCKPCDGGTYSLGGGIRYEDFEKLPEGFQIQNVQLKSSSSDLTDPDDIPCPTDRGWRVSHGTLMYIPTWCLSILTYSAKLVRVGSVEYTFRKPPSSRGSSLLFTVNAQNEQCQSYRDSYEQYFQKHHKSESGGGGDSGQARWRVNKLSLNAGQNVISFKAMGSWKRRKALDESGSSSVGGKEKEDVDLGDPMLISRIDVIGVPYTFECSKCPSGTYSSPGASSCGPCQANEYSKRGSSSCSKCSKAQYSAPRSSECTTRPPCKDSDFYKSSEDCDASGNTKIVYKWILPHICDHGISGSVQLPPPTQRKCPQCNPGMHQEGGKCEFCGKMQYSDGNSKCSKCPVDTVPNYGYQFITWNNLPSQLSTMCEIYSKEEEFGECTDVDSWLPAGNRIHTAHTRRPGAILELRIRVPGFKNPLISEKHISLRNPIGHITFTFTTKCSSKDCTLYFAEGDINGKAQTRVIADWNGTYTQRTVYRHPITRKGAIDYFWFFVRSHIVKQENGEADGAFMDDEASLYMINITNTLDGGASTCLPCPINTGHKKGCVPCPPGNYIEAGSHKCVRCPTNTMLNTSSNKAGPESCTKCGPNLYSSDGVNCVSNGTFRFASLKTKVERKYDLNKLMKSTYEVQGMKIFGGKGAGYLHAFNVSISGHGKTVNCYDSFAAQNVDSTLTEGDNEWAAVQAMVCRVTVVPWEGSDREGEEGGPGGNGSSTVFISPLAVGTRLIGVSTRKELDGIRLSAKVLDIDSRTPDEVLDVHFYYRSDSGPSTSCPEGHSAVVTLRCDPMANRTLSRLPRQCPDGTCDGCLFHIILSSPDACPLCDDAQFQEIRGECVKGFQTIHSIPAKHCVLSGQKAQERRVVCIVFGPEVQLITGIASATAILLLCVLIFVCKRNKKLEYKYMKLVESKTGKGGDCELPAAESCALDEDEDEEDENQDGERVIFSRGGGAKKKNSGGGGIFSKWGNGGEEDKRALTFDMDMEDT